MGWGSRNGRGGAALCVRVLERVGQGPERASSGAACACQELCSTPSTPQQGQAHEAPRTADLARSLRSGRHPTLCACNEGRSRPLTRSNPPPHHHHHHHRCLLGSPRVATMLLQGVLAAASRPGSSPVVRPSASSARRQRRRHTLPRAEQHPQPAPSQPLGSPPVPPVLPRQQGISFCRLAAGAAGVAVLLSWAWPGRVAAASGGPSPGPPSAAAAAAAAAATHTCSSRRISSRHSSGSSAVSSSSSRSAGPVDVGPAASVSVGGVSPTFKVQNPASIAGFKLAGLLQQVLSANIFVKVRWGAWVRKQGQRGCHAAA